MANAAESITATPTLKVVIERDVLLKTVGRLQSIVERRNTIPILGNIKLESHDGGLLLTATDMDIVASEAIAANTELDGAITVPAQMLYDIVRKLPEGAQIELDGTAANGQVLVRSGSSKFTLSSLPADEFPIISEGTLTHQFTLPTQTLFDLFDKARFAMSNEETRYYLNGVFLHVPSNDTATLRAVATDGHRLAKINAPIPEGAAGMPGIIVPRKTVNELHKLFEGQDNTISIGVSETKIRLQSGKASLVSKLIDGNFPDYERVIPQNNDKLLEIDTKALSSAVDRVSTISLDKTRGIKFSLAGGELTLSATSQEGGNAEEKLAASYSSDALEIGFNSRYVLEVLSQLEGDAVSILLADPNAPAVVRDPSESTAVYVIMPMRV